MSGGSGGIVTSGSDSVGRERDGRHGAPARHGGCTTNSHGGGAQTAAGASWDGAGYNRWSVRRSRVDGSSIAAAGESRGRCGWEHNCGVR